MAQSTAISPKNLLITGGAGFIGSHTVRRFVQKYPDYTVYNLDSLTYAGNLENLSDIEQAPSYRFIKGDIGDGALVRKLFAEKKFDGVIHLAAASHVDRSLNDPQEFVRANVVGTANLLHAAAQTWGDDPKKRFYYVSTDEVYGALGRQGLFTEQSSLRPRSPYAASKASGDHLASAFYHSYGLPVVISRCSNNYGPYQFPEKLIALAVNNLLNEREIPVYGRGENVRDWLYVADHVEAIDRIFHHGKTGSVYNVGGDNERKNIELIKTLCRVVDRRLGRAEGSSETHIAFVKDRPGHDFRYAIDATRLREELKWTPTVSMEEGLRLTVDWYLAHREWLDNVTSGAYRAYYEKMYIHR